MPLKFRRTLSMEDLQNASDDEMDVLLSPSEDSPKKCMERTCTSSASPHKGGSQRERFFPFSLLSNDTTSASSSSAPPTQNHRPRPKLNHVPIIVPVEMPDSDDFFLHGPQAPILKLEGSSTGVNLADNRNCSGRINGISSEDSSNHSSNATYHESNIPRSKSVRFEEPDEEECHTDREGSRDHRPSIQSQVNQVTQKMKDNIGRLLEREANLDSLAGLSDQLHYSGDIYRQSTEHVRRKLWWRHQKTRFVLTALFIFFTVLLFVPLISRLLGLG